MKTIQTKLSILITGLLCSFSGDVVYAEESSKSGYHLFSPTPRHLMRELSTDRPDKTESPYTVDAGHFQVEIDAISFAFDNENGLTRRTIDVMTTNIKVGLANSHDLQIVLPVFTGATQWLDNPPSSTRPSRFPELIPLETMIIRWKWNLMGNDQGDIAFAAMPWAEISFDNTDEISVGIILPASFPLFNDLSTAAMIEIDRIAVGGSTYQNHLIISGTIGRDLSASWGAYAELFTDISEDISPISTFDLGITLGVSSSLQLDTGMNIGLSRAADDYNPFLGASVRF